MPMPPALSSPYGNGPGDLGGAVPGQQQVGSQPSAAPAGVPNAPAQSAPQSPQVSGGATGSQPSQNPFDTPLSEDQRRKLESEKNGGPTVKNPFDEKDPNFPSGYIALSPRLRKTPSGSLETLRGGGKWEPLSGREYEVMTDFSNLAHELGIRAKEDLPRFAGAVMGGALGSLAGPAGTVAGAGVGQAAAGAAQDYLEKGQTPTLGGAATDVAAGAAGALLPMGVGKFLEGQAARFGAEAAMRPALEAGGKILAARAADRVKAADELGMSLRPDQVNPENTTSSQAIQQIMSQGGPEAQKLALIQANQKAKLLESRDNLVDKLQGPYKGELGEDNPSFANVFGTILSNHEQAIAKIKGQAFNEANGKLFDADPILEVMRNKITALTKENLFSDKGRLDPNLLSNMKEIYGTIPEAARPLIGDYVRLWNGTQVGRNMAEVGAFKNSGVGDKIAQSVSAPPDPNIVGTAASLSGDKLKQGLTLGELDVFRKEFGDSANFHKVGDRSETERAYGDVYYAARSHLDNKMTDILKPVDPTAAARLMGHKDFYSSFKEDAQDFQKQVEHDPTNAASALVDGTDPQKTQSLLSLLDQKQKSYIAGGFLENLTRPMVDASGKMSVTPIETRWNKVDPKVKQLLFGDDEKQINSIVKVARAISDRDIQTYDPTVDPLTKRAVGAIKSMKNTEGAFDFIVNLFKRNPKARDYISGEASNIMMPVGQDMASLAKKQILMNHASKVMLSKPLRAAASFGAADIGRSINEGKNEPIPDRAQ